MQFLMFLSSVRRLALLGGAATLAGCATLPSSGPTAQQVVKRAIVANQGLQFQIVNLDATTVATLANPASTTGVGGLATLKEQVRATAVGPGDVLSVTLYEVGVSLFSSTGSGAGGTFDPSAHSERFPQVPVDDRGMIELPYIGQLNVAGSTPSQIAHAIEQSLIAKSQMPQALVTIAGNVTNAVYVSGDVRKPGRLDLSPSGERLLDAVALAGGSAFPLDDTLVRLERRGRVVEQRLGTILRGSDDDVALVPGDRIELIHRARSFTVFGATPRVSQVAFEAASLSLAEAVARVGGPSDNTADPTAVFLFRYDDPLGADGRPVIYRLNMLDPASYFVAQRFTMHDKDVIYIANAAANQPTKLVGIINQLFAPFITVREATR
jgi:polysaccharide export outer membrane protein